MRGFEQKGMPSGENTMVVLGKVEKHVTRHLFAVYTGRQEVNGRYLSLWDTFLSRWRELFHGVMPAFKHTKGQIMNCSRYTGGEALSVDRSYRLSGKP